MVSDMVRYTKLPFCGLRPFMRMVADVAKDALQAGCATNAAYLGDAETCKFTFVEGGAVDVYIEKACVRPSLNGPLVEVFPTANFTVTSSSLQWR